jgi:hypothetical protein
LRLVGVLRRIALLLRMQLLPRRRLVRVLWHVLVVRRLRRVRV